MAAQLEQHIGTLFGGGRPQLGQPDPLGRGEGPRHPGERGPVPFAERGFQLRDRLTHVPRSPQPAAPLKPALEDDGVDFLGVQPQHVPGARGGQHLAGPPAGAARFEEPAQAGHVGVHAALGTGRGLLAPHGVNKLITGHHPVGPHGEHAQYGLLPGRPGREFPVGKPGPHGSQDAYAQRLGELTAAVHVIDGHRCLSTIRPFFGRKFSICALHPEKIHNT